MMDASPCEVKTVAISTVEVSNDAWQQTFKNVQILLTHYSYRM
jgi:hypothetical protein